MAGKRIALGLTLGRELDATVALRWIALLRESAWIGPVYNGRAAYTVQARNIVLEQAFAELDKWDALLYWDSDQLPPMKVPPFADWRGGYFTEYLSWLDKPVVGGLYFSREDVWNPKAGVLPHEPVAYHRFENSTYRYLTVEELMPMLTRRGRYVVGGLGTGAMLIDKSILLRLAELKAPRPIFEAPEVPEGAGTPGRQWTEDLYFCEQVQTLLGEQIWLDTAMESAHRADVWIASRHYMAARGIVSMPSGEGKPKAPSKIVGLDGRPIN